MRKGKFGRGNARGARGGGKSMEMSENTYFTAAHSSAGLFRISYGMHYMHYIFCKLEASIAISRQLIIEVPNDFAFIKKCVVAHIS